MSAKPPGFSRREILHSLGLVGVAAAVGCGDGKESSGPISGGLDSLRAAIAERVGSTPFVDTHEHLPDEADRLAGQVVPCDDWSLLLHDYLSADLLSAGMSSADSAAFFSRNVDPLDKWKILEPYWPRVMNTGFGRAVRITIRELYGLDDLDQKVIPHLQDAYEDLRRPGFYETVLVEEARIESCQVNSPGLPFHKSRQPTLLMQDLSFQNMHIEPDIEDLSAVAGIRVGSLGDWQQVIRWWFDNYSTYAVAAKSQGAYLRGLNYRPVDQDDAEPVFDRVLRGERVTGSDKKLLEDHLFWFCVDEATRNRLPVKIHTGFPQGNRIERGRRLTEHPQDIIELCRRSPQTRFVFLHICYPYWQELIAVVKRFANAYVDMSWAWITDPAAAREFLKRCLVSVPSNKIFTFGGDYSVVECVSGHAVMARRGIVKALAELVEEGWLRQQDALGLVEPLLRSNARRVFNLEEKTRVLSQAPWV